MLLSFFIKSWFSIVYSNVDMYILFFGQFKELFADNCIGIDKNKGFTIQHIKDLN